MSHKEERDAFLFPQKLHALGWAQASRNSWKVNVEISQLIFFVLPSIYLSPESIPISFLPPKLPSCLSDSLNSGDRVHHGLLPGEAHKNYLKMRAHRDKFWTTGLQEPYTFL